MSQNLDYRIGAYNVRKGRSRRRVALEVRLLMRWKRLDALTLCEVATQHKYLTNHLPKHLDVFGYPNRGVAARDSAIVVNMRRQKRKGRAVYGKRLLAMGDQGWERAPRNRHKGLHNVRKAVHVRIGPLAVIADHWPPGPYDSPAYPLRTLAHLKMQMTVAALARRWNKGKRPFAGAWILPSDKNMRPDERRAYRLARLTKASRTGNGIDWALAGPLVEIIRQWRVRMPFFRSDHKPVISVLRVVSN